MRNAQRSKGRPRVRRQGLFALVAIGSIVFSSGCTAADVALRKPGCDTPGAVQPGESGTSLVRPTGSFVYPVKEGTTQITSGFGERWGAQHQGLDFAGPLGTPIYAALDGVVVKSGEAQGFGNWIVIDSLTKDGEPVSTVYGHMRASDLLVKEGDQVKAGQHISNIGNEGGSTGPHLHFEYWNGGRSQGGTAIDPEKVLTAAQKLTDGAPSSGPGMQTNSEGKQRDDVQLVSDTTVTGDCTGFGTAGGGDLAAGSIPLPELEPWLRKAGALCPQIRPPLLAAQQKKESGFRRGLTSPDGAKGLTQFMDGTFAAYGKDDDGNGKVSIWDDGDAIMAQGRYMCAIAQKVDAWIAAGTVKGEPKALYLAAYNAGEGAVQQAGGMPSGGYDYEMQTKPYVALILQWEKDFESVGSAGEFVPTGGSAAGPQVVSAASQYFGTPYVWGGGDITGPTKGGLDCSGLTSAAVYAASGGKTKLPRTSEEQWTVGREIPIDQTQPGDLVFGGWESKGPGHVGIYAGNGQMIHAPTTGDVVKRAPLQSGMKARRVL